MGSFIIGTHHQILGKSIKENEVGRVCGIHGSEEKRVQGVDGKAQRKQNTRKTWFPFAQDIDWWRALVNAVMKLRVLAPRC
jgi:hypothetical protein